MTAFPFVYQVLLYRYLQKSPSVLLPLCSQRTGMCPQSQQSAGASSSTGEPVPALLPQPARVTRNCVTAQGRAGPCSPAGFAGVQPTATETPQPQKPHGRDRDPAGAEGEPPATPRVQLHAGICPRRLGCNYSVKLGGSV